MQPPQDLPQRAIERGPIAEMLSLIPGDRNDPEVRKMRKAAIASAVFAAAESRSLRVDGVVVESVRQYEMHGEPAIEVTVAAAGLAANANPFIFVNPPFVTADGKEDPAAALEEAIAKAVATSLRRKG